MTDKESIWHQPYRNPCLNADGICKICGAGPRPVFEFDDNESYSVEQLCLPCLRKIVEALEVFAKKHHPDADE